MKRFVPRFALLMIGLGILGLLGSCARQETARTELAPPATESAEPRQQAAAQAPQTLRQEPEAPQHEPPAAQPQVARQEPPAQPVAPPPPPPPKRMTLAPGSTLVVRTTNTLSTETANSGDVFVATLEQPISDGRTVFAAKGARVEGTVADSDLGGRVKGRASITVRLSRLYLPTGEAVDLVTNTVSREAASSRKKDATKIGLGGGIGAAVGAIAGGGKGAAIGAAAGAGAGTGTVLATRGDPALIPSETVLTFILRAPVRITLPAQ